VLGASSLSAQVRPQVVGAKADTDSIVASVADKVYQARAVVGAVWPVYWPKAQPFALYPFKGKALVVDPSRTVKSTNPNIPAALRSHAFLQSGPLPRDNMFVTDYRVRDLKMPLVAILDSVYAVHDPETATLVYLYHEGFHGYQLHHFMPTHGKTHYGPLTESEVSMDVLRKKEFRAYAAIERRILADALATHNLDVRKELLREYVAVRGARGSMMSADDAEAEAQTERKEGSANYVGYVAGISANGGTRDAVASVVIKDLLSRALELGDFVSEFRHKHVYATGAAIGLLLDDIDAKWKAKMEAGATFPELLALYVTHSAGIDSSALEGVLARYEYPTLLARLSGP
jgi:hypothetical protein